MNGSYLCVIHSPGEILPDSWWTSVEIWAALREGREQMAYVWWGGGWGLPEWFLAQDRKGHFWLVREHFFGFRMICMSPWEVWSYRGKMLILAAPDPEPVAKGTITVNCNFQNSVACYPFGDEVSFPEGSTMLLFSRGLSSSPFSDRLYLLLIILPFQ